MSDERCVMEQSDALTRAGEFLFDQLEEARARAWSAELAEQEFRKRYETTPGEWKEAGEEIWLLRLALARIRDSGPEEGAEVLRQIANWACALPCSNPGVYAAAQAALKGGA